MYGIFLANPFSTLWNYIIHPIDTIRKILGAIINLIFEGLNVIGIPNIALSIILFTVIIYLLLLPSTIKQQKFSKLSQKMSPELKAIQKKYKDKKDQVSMMKMNEETKAVYEKYGTSPTGGCLQMLITLPIFFALYRVVYQVPQYIKSIGNVYSNLANKIAGNADIINAINDAGGKISEKATATEIMNALYMMNTDTFKALGEKVQDISSLVNDVAAKMSHYNNFLGVNIANSPMNLIQTKAPYYIFIALLIPIMSGGFQWLTTKIMPSANAGVDDENPMANSMKSMNMIFPIFTIVICFTMPISMGLYWVTGSVFRFVQQLVINKRFEKVDVNELIEKNLEKVNKKRAKKGLPPKTLTAAAKTNTRNVEKIQKSQEERQEEIKKSTNYYNNTGNPGSIRAKANMVKQYNERNNKK